MLLIFLNSERKSSKQGKIKTSFKIRVEINRVNFVQYTNF